MPLAEPVDLRTGVRDIDGGTEGLCYLMGRLFDPLVECRRRHGGCDRRHCTRVAALMTYLERSFAREEALMAAADYPQAGQHRHEHERLAAVLGHMHDGNVCADRDRAQLDGVIGRWLRDHVGKADRRLGRWALTRRLRPPG